MGESPHLFHLHNPTLVADAPAPAFSTPLGRLRIDVMVEGVPIPSTAISTAGDQAVTVWSGPVRIELLFTHPPVSLLEGLMVTEATAAVWRVAANETARSVVVRCFWESGATWTEGGADSGQGLDAQTWTDGCTKVTVGLPDYETATVYRSDGFEVTVGPTTGCEGHFLCAWGPDVPDDNSTHFAADCPTYRLVATDI